ncbi:DUF3267 domain-containing protein [Bacillus sp. HNG]|uniref:DUF3267 domain-containing protein n=1 Tax=Bacillus sp. HNG TaxID=2293325 RepID=UPI000E2E95B4|nr:DUF3267 domain-containing protein [Bacillus sp. HNG]RFB18410.1 DUF3267 domain-containing protein [Bacillus sp. HNG]
MTCWKTINLSKDYGFHRIILISLISMFIAFILFYLPLNLMYSSVELREDGAIYFLLALLLIYPIHATLHVLPFWISGKKLTVTFKWMYGIIPIVTTRSKHSLSKPFIICVMGTPFLFITALMLGGCVVFPGFIHYFSIIAAINFGLCVPDFIYLGQFVKAPRSCTVEEIEDGYDILIHN